MTEAHLKYLKKGLDHFSVKFDNCIVLGSFNSEISNKYLKALCESYNPKSLLKNRTCSKNHDKPTYIDFILANQQRCSQSSCSIGTEISVFHRLTVTVLKTYFQKQESNAIMYRGYKKLSNQLFPEKCIKELSGK